MLPIALGGFVTVLGGCDSQGVISGQLDLIEVHGPAVMGAARGIQLAILTTILGGVPAAVLAIFLAWRYKNERWAMGWWHVFVGGFAFQLTSLFLTSVMLLFWGITPTSHLLLQPREVLVGLLIGLGLLISSLCSAFALRSWGALRCAVSSDVTVRLKPDTTHMAH